MSHYKKLREFVYEHKDDEKTLGICDIEVWKMNGRKTALYVEEFVFDEDENKKGYITFHDLICYCDYCKDFNNIHNSLCVDKEDNHEETDRQKFEKWLKDIIDKDIL